MGKPKLSVYFHRDQLDHRPLYEWAFGKRLPHPETTERAANILRAIRKAPEEFDVRPPVPMPIPLLSKIHSRELVTLLKTARQLPLTETYYPNVFPVRADCRPNPRNLNHAGYFCFDSGTPLNRTTWMAALWSASCARNAALEVLTGKYALSYALCRPPGHHASRDLFGGYCYFNNAAIAVEVLKRKHRRIALVDIDFHHGNGTQELFYRDPSVFFASLHGDPREYYPYFSGYAHESGAARAVGSTVNVPLPQGTDLQEYLRALDRKVLKPLKAFRPTALVLSAGLDTFEGDPIGDFTLRTADFHPLGERFGRLGLPTVVVQEGGYCTKALGANVVSLLSGIRAAFR